MSELNRPAYEQLLREDLDWLLKQPRTLERDHIADVLRWNLSHRVTNLEADLSWVLEELERVMMFTSEHRSPPLKRAIARIKYLLERISERKGDGEVIP